MANTIHRHLPAYVTGRDNVSATYETTGQLLAIEWVAVWTTVPKFHRFSVSKGIRLLMAEFNEGNSWFVVGRFEAEESLLPAFEPKPWYAPAGLGIRSHIDSLAIQYPNANGNYITDKIVDKSP